MELIHELSANASFLPLVECPTEDSTDCVWDATTHGNGHGQSFIDLNGTAYTLDVPEGHYIWDAYTNPASPTGYTVLYMEHDTAPVTGIDPILPIAIVASAIVASIVTIVTGYVRRC